LLCDAILAAREWQLEGMGITNENGNKIWHHQGLEMKMNQWKWEGMGLKKTFPLYYGPIVNLSVV